MASLNLVLKYMEGWVGASRSTSLEYLRATKNRREVLGLSASGLYKNTCS